MIITDVEFRRMEAARLRAYREAVRLEQPEKHQAIKARDRERMRRRRAQARGTS